MATKTDGGGGGGGVPAPRTKAGGVVTKVADAVTKARSPVTTVRNPTVTVKKGGKTVKLTHKQAKILGIVLGVVLGIVLIVVLFLFIRAWRKKRRVAKYTPTEEYVPPAEKDVEKDGDMAADTPTCTGPYSAAPPLGGIHVAETGTERAAREQREREEREREERTIALETAQARENEDRNREATFIARETAEAQSNRQTENSTATTSSASSGCVLESDNTTASSHPQNGRPLLESEK